MCVACVSSAAPAVVAAAVVVRGSGWWRARQRDEVDSPQETEDAATAPSTTDA
jgi:predicted nucleic acid-binding Zn ribbon protein